MFIIFVLSAFLDTFHNYSDINTDSRVLNNALLNAKCCLLETMKHDTLLKCQHGSFERFKNKISFRKKKRKSYEVSCDEGKCFK